MPKYRVTGDVVTGGFYVVVEAESADAAAEMVRGLTELGFSELKAEEGEISYQKPFAVVLSVEKEEVNHAAD